MAGEASSSASELRRSAGRTPHLSLRDVSLELSYDESTAARLLEDFYLPCLSRSVAYDRAAGYFRSSIYVLAGVAMSGFALRGGSMRLVCSPQLNPRDVLALREAEELRHALDQAVEKEIRAMLAAPATLPVVRLLSTLIVAGALEIKLSYPLSERGIFHDKLGIFVDEAGDVVSFRGSANETMEAWDRDANAEGFEAFKSWAGGTDAERVTRHRRYFENLWSDRLEKLVVCGLGERAWTLLEAYAHPDGVEGAVEEVRDLVVGDRTSARTRRPVLQEHQSTIVENWFAAGCRGIVDHVTGAGKTISALEITRRWLGERGPVIVFVPSILLAKQWVREIERYFTPGEVALLQAHSEGDDWRQSLRDFTTGDGDFGPRITIATYATGSTPGFIDRVEPCDDLLVVADEVHRAGSPNYQRMMELDAGARLGLSATPERFGDPTGTAAIFRYFGQILAPTFTIADGIRCGRLVPYDYHVRIVEFTDTEWEQWTELTEQIAPLFARQKTKGDHGETVTHSARLQQLLIRRARIKKQAVNKIAIAADVVADAFDEGDRWLVYCDSQTQLQAVREALEARGINADEYHSAMSGARDETLEHFEARGGVLVAIKCLDEGIDIPVTDHALILASSVNSREFIQRRGRVLRAHPAAMKFSATIYDTLVSAPGGSARGVVLRAELDRALVFAATARNAAVKMQLARLSSLADLGGDDSEDDENEE